MTAVGLCSVIHVRTQPGVLRYARFVDVGGGEGAELMRAETNNDL